MALLWGKVKFFFKTMLTLGLAGSTLTASTTETTGFFDVDHLINWLEAFSWKADDTVDPVTITFDAGAGNTPTADYLGIRRHNLGTLVATAVLQNSTDNFASDIETVIAERFLGDMTILREARLIAGGGFEVWQEGVGPGTDLPTGWSDLVGAGATVAREATIVKNGLYSAALTRAGTDCFFDFNVQNFAFYAGKTVTIGCWVYATVADAARLVLFDGAGSVGSPFHSGTPGYEFLQISRTIDASPTRLTLRPQIKDFDTTAYFDDAVMKVASSVASTDVSDFIQPESNGKRYWRLKVADDNNAAFTAPPSMSIAVWGDKVELDHASTAFDPNAEEPDVNINRGFGGIVTGIHEKSLDRAFTLGFTNKDAAFYAKVDDWWQTHGRQQLFVGWNTDDFPDDVYLMYPDGNFRNPRSMSGDNERRFVTIDLRGVKE